MCLCVWSPHSPPHTLPLETGLRHASQHGIPLLKSLRKLSVALSKTGLTPFRTWPSLSSRSPAPSHTARHSAPPRRPCGSSSAPRGAVLRACCAGGRALSAEACFRASSSCAWRLCCLALNLLPCWSLPSLLLRGSLGSSAVRGPPSALGCSHRTCPWG